MTTRKPPHEEVLALVLLHVPIAILGTLLVAIVLGWPVGAIFSRFGMRRFLFAMPYNPFLWISGALLGLFVNRFARNRSACWVGAIALVYMFAIMVWDISIFRRSDYYATLTHGHYWKYEFGQLFSPDNATCSASECLGQLLVTFPVVASVAYSIGAWLALRFRHDDVRTAR